MIYETPKVEIVEDENMREGKRSLNAKLTKLGWALFFISIGGIWISNNLGRINDDKTWALVYVVIGLILLGLNIVRLIVSIRPSRFTAVIGSISLAAGIGKYYNIGDISIVAVALVVIGILMIFETFKK